MNNSATGNRQTAEICHLFMIMVNYHGKEPKHFGFLMTKQSDKANMPININGWKGQSLLP